MICKIYRKLKNEQWFNNILYILKYDYWLNYHNSFNVNFIFIKFFMNIYFKINFPSFLYLLEVYLWMSSTKYIMITVENIGISLIDR